MMYAFSPGGCQHASIALPEFDADLANFLLTRGPYAWLGHGWMGCSQQYVILCHGFVSLLLPPSTVTATAFN